jgi:hypothetical protein
VFDMDRSAISWTVQTAADDADLIAGAATILEPLEPKRVNIESASLTA